MGRQCPGSQNTRKEDKNKATSLGSVCCGSAVMNLPSIHEDLGSIPGLPPWVKDLGLPWGGGGLADMAQIPCCWGCGVDWAPRLGTSICCGIALKKKKKKKKRQKQRVQSGLWCGRHSRISPETSPRSAHTQDIPAVVQRDWQHLCSSRRQV